MTRSIGVVLSIVLTAIVLVGSGAQTTQACSCNLRDPIKTFGDGLATFTGVATEVRFLADFDEPGEFVAIDIEVQAVVRGDVPDSITVFMELGTSCGGDPWPLVGQPVFVTTYGSAQRPLVGGCQHPAVLGAATPVLGTPPEPTSDQPPAMLAIGTFGPADLVLLDASGDVVSVAEVDGQIVDAAHCANSSRVLLQLLDPERLVMFDLSEMAVIDAIDAGTDFDPAAVACAIDGTGTIKFDGLTLVVDDGTAQVERDLSGAEWTLSRQIDVVQNPNGAGGIIVLATRVVGGQVHVFDAASLERNASLPLGPAEFIEEVAVDQTGSSIAVLVSDPVRQDGLWQKSLVLLTFDGNDLVRVATVSLDRLDRSDSFATSLHWLDTAHLVIGSVDQSGDNQRLDVVSIDGAPVTEIDALGPWPVPLETRDGVAWFVDDGTLTRLGTDGATVPVQLDRNNGLITKLTPLSGVGPVLSQSVEPLLLSTPTPIASTTSTSVAATVSTVEQSAIAPRPAIDRSAASPTTPRGWIVGGVGLLVAVGAAAVIARRRQQRRDASSAS